MITLKSIMLGATIFAAGFVAATFLSGKTVEAQQSGKVFELRTYTTLEGKLPNLNARFSDHTMAIFEGFNMENIGYWVPEEIPDQLIYIIAHDSRQAADENWSNFRNNPDWLGIAEASGVGQLQIERVFMTATNYSPLK